MVFLSKAFSVDKEIILKKLESLTSEEKKDLTNFFKICSYSYQFSYTIFGEKPMSLDGLGLNRPKFEDLEYKEDEWVRSSYRKKEGWDVWKKHFQDLPLNNFSLIFYPVPNHPELIHFSIINHKMFLDIVEKHIEEFHKVLNRKISSQEILNGYIKAEGEIFERIKNHEGLLGIILGYGKENSFKYMRKEKLSPSVDPLSLKGRDMSEMLLPTFMVAEGSEETKKIMASFSKQRERINKLYYQKENFLELVLLKLFCTE
jgi:hypothetical protein